MSRADPRVVWSGAARRRGGVSLVCGSCTEREKASVDAASGVGGLQGREGSVPRQKPKALSTDAALAGGPARSSWEAAACLGGRWGEGAGSPGMSNRSTGAERLWEEARRDMPKPKDKPFAIPKSMVWEAWRQVKDNKGAPGVDGEDLEAFEADLEGNLYKIWNRMSSGTYFPPPVRAVEIPKPHSPGTRVLGVPTVADRIAQTTAAMYLEPLVDTRFHDDSYGYRPGRSQLDALAACRRRCWKYDWIIDLDVQKFLVPSSHCQ